MPQGRSGGSSGNNWSHSSAIVRETRSLVLTRALDIGVVSFHPNKGEQGWCSSLQKRDRKGKESTPRELLGMKVVSM